MNRRHFLQQSSSCSAYLASLSAFGLSKAFAKNPKRKIVAEEKWGRLEEIAPGTWALISTPFSKKDYTTVCNSGIIAGKKGSLVIEGTMQPKGAQWLSKQCEILTGRQPTDLVITHFHGDHVNGHSGYPKPKTWITAPSQKGAEDNFKKATPIIPPFHDVQELSTEKPTEIDLGGRSVKIVPHHGHTTSDVTIEISDPEVIWTGDLYFNRLFPNYGDSIPNLLNGYAKELDDLDDSVVIVPGHGSLAGQAEVKIYREFLHAIETATTSAHKAGTPAAEAAKAYKLPESLSDWLVWSPQNISRAFDAWYRVLEK